MAVVKFQEGVVKDVDRMMPKSPSGSRFEDDMNVFGLRLAPLSLPLSRRLQTAAVAFFVWLFSLSCTCTCVLLYCLLFHWTEYRWVALLYISWVIFDRDIGETGGRTFRWTRSLSVWRYFRDYFPISLIKTADLDPSRSYVVGYHPHGIMAFGCVASFGTSALSVGRTFPGLTWRVATLPIQFWLPGTREFTAGMGSISSTKSSLEHALSVDSGQATVIVVGGATEALNYHSDTVELYLNRRMGFVKMALRFGRDLVPAFCFGENFIYGQAPNPEGSRLRRFQRWFEKNLSFSPPVFYGRGIFQYNFGFLPYRRAMNVVVGRPIRVDRVEEPTAEQVRDLHDRYVEELRKLYEDNNAKYGDPKVKLVIS